MFSCRIMAIHSQAVTNKLNGQTQAHQFYLVVQNTG